MKLITKLRLAANLTKAGLARKATVNASTISAIELGRLKAYPGQLKKLAKALDHPVARSHELEEELD